MPTHRFQFPTLIHFGPGARRELGPFLKSQGVARPLFVTDQGLAALPVFEELVQMAAAAGLAPGRFGGVGGNPVKSQVTGGVAAYRAHQADAIVGVGGGAALDVAKAVALMVAHPGDLFDYEDDKPGARPIDQPIPLFVAVPTTAGTGSEVGRSAVISDDETHVKKIVFSPRLLARAVFADPELTLGLPPKVTAATGMDALTHCIEAYLAKDYHPICDGIALEGLKLASRSLERAVKDGSDLAARGDMLMASMMGAIAFQKGLGLTHSCAHPLSTVANLHHGLANGVMIDYALAFNAEAVPEKFRDLAATVGLEDRTPAAFLAWLRDLKVRVGIPRTLTEAGVSPAHLDRLADLAVADVCHANNPRPCTRADFHRIYTQAFAP
jgi:alcohol dehydrogenase class IV